MEFGLVSKRAFIFPGQGSQYVGMAKDVYENSSKAKQLVEEAEEAIKYNISEVMFEGPEEKLKSTDITQPALFIHSAMLLNELNSHKPDVVAGHSLGELTALYAAESLNFSDAIKLIRKRGEAMLSAGQKESGSMAAIIGMDGMTIENICSEASEDGIVQCANFNSPGQIVISGASNSVKKVMTVAKDNGARLVKELVVSGAFHSPLMNHAVEMFSATLNGITLNDAKIPVYANVTAESVTENSRIKELLLKQLTAPVKWQQTIENMINDGVDEFVEIGSGKVLQGLVKRINPNVKIIGIDRYIDLDKLN
jgi:[acyl-carrier-protein] S-malonyltransferase